MKRTSDFPYHQVIYERPPCNLCGGINFRNICKKDRNGLDVNTAVCTTCGLVSINPRMTPQWYSKYYQKEYRSQMSWNKGFFDEEIIAKYYTPEKFYHKARAYAERIYKKVGEYIRPGLMIEVGSSSGGILSYFRDTSSVRVLGIEPSVDEARYAEGKNIETVIGLFEEVDKKIEQADTIVCVQSLNHLLSPSEFFRWSYEHLSPQGRLIVDVVNFEALARRIAYLEKVVQIDHVFMFTPRTLRLFAEQAGFLVLFLNADQDPKLEHMVMVAEKIPIAKEVVFDTSEAARITTLPNSYLRFMVHFGMRRALKRFFAYVRFFVKKFIKKNK